MATSREVAEAYIEVHGDLSEFRKDLNKAGDDARRAGEANADDFQTGWNKRIQSGVRDKWTAMLDAMYTNNKLDWDKLIGKFDNGDLDQASEDIEQFMIRMRAAGKLTKDQYDEMTTAVRRAIKEKQQEIFVQKDLEEVTRAHTEAIRENIKFDKLRAQEAAQNVRDITRAHTEALKENAAFDKSRTAELARQTEKVVEQSKAMKDITDHDRDRPNLILKALDAMSGVNRSTKEAHQSTGALHTIAEKLRISWARTDSTVRLVLGLILAAAGPMAVLGSGLAGSAVALASSLAYAVGALGAMVGPMAAFGVAIALAISSFDEILNRVPRIGESIQRISDAWGQQADKFGRQWEGALDRVLNTFATRLEEFDFGTPLGKSIAQVTDAFDKVLQGPSFNAFMTEMTTNFPKAVEGIGTGLAGLTNGFLALFAGAGPVAAKLGEDFANWGNKIGEALEKARQSGQITALFERMRESLLVVLDLVGSVGMALGTLFELGASSGNNLIRSLTQIVDKFNEWMKTDAGRATMLQWFQNAERIVRALEPVAVGLGKALATLVTPFLISQFENLMQSVGDLLPALANILKVVSDLGILNILAELLNVVAQAVQPLLPPLSELAQVIGPVIQQVFRALAPLISGVAVALVPLVTAIARMVEVLAPQLIPALVKLVEVITPIVTKIIEMAVAIATKLIPVVGPLLVGYINATVAAFEILGKGIGFVVDVLSTVVTGLVNFFSNLGENITNFNETVNQGFEQFWTGVQQMFTNFITGFQTSWDNFWGGLGANIANIWTGIQTQFTTGWTNLTTGFTNWVTGFQQSWDQFWGGIGEGLNVIWTGVQTVITTAWNNIVTGLTAVFVTPFQQIWSAFWNGLDPELKAVIEGIVLSIQMGWQSTLDNLNKFVTDFINGWNGFWGDVAAENDKKWRETIDGFNRWTTDINNTVNSFISKAVADWNRFWGDVGNRASQGWSQIIGGFNNWANDINGTVNRFVNEAIGNWNRFWGDIFSRASQGWSQIIGGFNNWANSVNAVVNGWINGAISSLQGAWNTITTGVTVALNGFASIVQGKLNEAGNFFRNLPGIIGGALANLANQLYSIGANAIGALANAISNGAGRIVSAITGAVGGAINWAKSLLGINSPSKVFTNFGDMTVLGYIEGVTRHEGDVRTATEKMLDGVYENFDKSKAFVAGKETGLGLAEGLASSKSRITTALGNIDPKINGDFAASITAKQAAVGTQVPQTATGGGVVIEEGAIQLVSKASSPEVLGGIVLDGLSDMFADRSKI